MYRLEDDLWWYRGQRRITKAVLDRHLPHQSRLDILDAGAGTGGSLALLKPLGCVTAFDFSEKAVAYYRSRERGRVAQASITDLPYADSSFDLVTIFDVLYLLSPQGETEGLSEVARVLKPGGHLYLREPAHMFLYGPHDAAVHARHRYNRGELRERLANAGITPLRMSYANSFLFPVAVARRLLARWLAGSGPPRSDVRAVPGPLNKVLTFIISAEAPFVARWGLPFGLSVVALGRKQ
jgi:SAM-dependent methyltransferase